MTVGTLKTRLRHHLDATTDTAYLSLYSQKNTAVFDTLRQHRPEEISEAEFL